MEQNKVYWVRGNTLTLVIPLEQEVIPQEGDVQVLPYYPAETSTVTVYIIGNGVRRPYTPTIDGNLLFITDNGNLPTGSYDIEVIVDNTDGSQYRSLWENQIVVTLQNDTVLQEWDDFRTQSEERKALRSHTKTSLLNSWRLFKARRVSKGHKVNRVFRESRGRRARQARKESKASAAVCCSLP